MTAITTPQSLAHPSHDGGDLLCIRDLNVYYGESHILRNVDLSIAPGQMVCLIGLNGVGKTTLLKTIIGLLQQRSGSIRLAGDDITAQVPINGPAVGSGMCPRVARSSVA